MTIEKFEDLMAWQRARMLTSEIYSMSRVGQFAKDFGLVDQIRRAAVSVGSAGEVRSQLYTAFDVGYISREEMIRLVDLSSEVSKLINGLIKSLRKTSLSGMRYNKP